MRLWKLSLLVLLMTAHHTSASQNVAEGKSVKPCNDSGPTTTEDFGNGTSSKEEEPDCWRVDLDKKYNISKIVFDSNGGPKKILTKVSIYVSVGEPSAGFSTPSQDWINITCNVTCVYEFNKPKEARNIIVYADASLEIIQPKVQVYEYNDAKIEKGPSCTSHLNGKNNSSLKVMEFVVRSGENFKTSDYEVEAKDRWWNFTLKGKVLFKNAILFLNYMNSSCESGNGNVTFLISKDAKQPSKNNFGNWNSCSVERKGVDGRYYITCGSENLFVGSLGILPAGEEVRNATIKIIGIELPKLSNATRGRLENITNSTLTMSFPRWNQQMVGGTPPTEYKVEITGQNETHTQTHDKGQKKIEKILPHVNNVDRLAVTFNTLTANTYYTVNVILMVQGENFSDAKTLLTTKTACKAPVINNPTCSRSKHGSREMWNCTIDWKVNCTDASHYVPSGIVHGIINSKRTNYTLFLNGDQNYTFQLKVVNSANVSSSCALFKGKTEELAPQFGSSTFNVCEVNTSCVKLRWEKPQFPGGTIQSYQYKCLNQSWITTESNVFCAESCGHNLTTRGTCSLRANNTLRSEEKTANTTKCAVPSSPSDLSHTSEKTTHMGRVQWKYTFRWQAPTRINCEDSVSYIYSINDFEQQGTSLKMADVYLNGSQSYTFTVQAQNAFGNSSSQTLNGTTGSLAPNFGENQLKISGYNSTCVKATWKVPQHLGEAVTQYHLTCDQPMKRTQHTKQTSALQCGFQPSSTVKCVVTAYNDEEKSNSITAYGETLSKVIIEELTEKLNFDLIAGVAVGCFLFLVVSLAMICFLHRRSNLLTSKATEGREFEEVPLETCHRPDRRGHDISSATPLLMKDRTDVTQNGLEESEEEGDIYCNSEEFAVKSEPIPVEKLEWYNKTNIETITSQYAELTGLPLPPSKAALHPSNRGKCRYKDLYTSDKHRVKLVRDNNYETDFINATYMRGYSHENKFIASMGPFNPRISADFWLMIWQQKPSAIIMVTRAEENLKMKCWQYWPTDEGETKVFGVFTITRNSIQMYPDFCISYLEVAMNEQKRVIPHFNFLTWPDHGVPDVEVFVAFHRLVKTTIHQGPDQPLLIHCSAGVGRTGTYIALDYLLEQAKVEGKVDMFGCVAEMRSRRPSMIQTEAQYVMLHRALYESLKTQSFICSPTDLQKKLESYQPKEESDSDAISTEYKHIMNRINSVDLSYEAGKLPENQEKNRFPEILPCDAYRMFLSSGVDGNYINAVTFNGYISKYKWIATQNPLPDTVVDFWQLMLEQGVEVVLQLEGARPSFYPLEDNTQMTVGPLIIERKNSNDEEFVEIIHISLRRNSNEMELNVLVVKDWTPESLPPPESFLAILETADRFEQQAQREKTCVVCLDGSTRCGLYICIHNALEKLKVEQEVDVYYPTLMAKMRRPQFASTLEQYAYMHQVIEDYSQKFGEYANFG